MNHAQMRNLWAGLRRKDTSPFLELDAAGNPRQVVRRLYQKVLAQAIELGSPRQKGQTPSTYLNVLSVLCPEERWALETLTSVYLSARYGAASLTDEQMQVA